MFTIFVKDVLVHEVRSWTEVEAIVLNCYPLGAIVVHDGEIWDVCSSFSGHFMKQKAI